MVYFVCETCNEVPDLANVEDSPNVLVNAYLERRTYLTLKKAQVEKHHYSCKGCWGVTCVDCNFTFEGDSFRAHTSCVSEDQKYQGALFKAPKAKQKNRGVNEIWADAVLLAASNASSGVAPKPLCAHLIRMGDLNNVPRQEKKFKNFVKNSMRVFDEGSVSKLWNYIDGIKNDITKREKEAAAPPEETKTTTEDVSAKEEVAQEKKDGESSEKNKKAKKSKKRAREEGGKEKEAEASGVESSGGGDGHGKRQRGGEAVEGEKANGGGRGRSDGGGGGDTSVAAAATVVDDGTIKALTKAAVGIVKKAPNKKITVKELVKQAAAAVSELGGAGSPREQQQQMRRALKQRLKEGLRRVTVEDKVAIYSGKGAA